MKKRNIEYRGYGGDRRGTKNPSAKLTDDQVREIRKLYATSEYSQTELGKRFGVAQSIIYRIVRGDAWAHLL